MKKYVGAFRTVLYLEGEEAKRICRLGQEEKCCPFLVVGECFECWYMNYPANETLRRRISEGTMNAKGKPCDWDEISKSAVEIDKNGVNNGTG